MSSRKFNWVILSLFFIALFSNSRLYADVYYATKDYRQHSSLVAGDCTLTEDSDGVSQSITETTLGWGQHFRYSSLRHTWEFVIAEYADKATLCLDAHQSYSRDHDGFVFKYSLSSKDDPGKLFTDEHGNTKGVINNFNTEDPAHCEPLELELPDGIGANKKIYIVVEDTNSSVFRTYQDTVFIDQMSIETRLLAPEPPQNVIATDGHPAREIWVTWKPVKNASSYTIYRSETVDGIPTLLAEQLSDTTYVDTSVDHEKPYYYWLQAFNRIGSSELSDYDCGLAFSEESNASKPNPSLGATNVHPNKILSWAPAEDALSYNVHLWSDPNFEDPADPDWADIDIELNTKEPSIKPITLVNGRTYYWRVDTVVDTAIGPYTYTGDEWEFYLPNTIKNDPSKDLGWWDEPTYPLDGSTHVYQNAVLEWPPIPDASNYFVYFGTDKENLSELANHLTDNRYALETMKLDNWYHWRIDYVDIQGVLHTGDIWSFYVPGLMTYPEDDQPIGGEVSYNGDDELKVYSDTLVLEEDHILIQEGVNRPSAKDQLLSALIKNYDPDEGLRVYEANDVNSDKTIYIADTDESGENPTEIDLTGYEKIPLPRGVKLVGNRGINGSKGALIYKQYANLHTKMLDANKFLFSIDNNSGFRITGLRFRGPAPYLTNKNENVGETLFHIVNCSKDSDIEIYNCELWNWSYAAIYIDDCGEMTNKEIEIHHNYIHDGYGPIGYGVNVQEGYPLITANIFDKLRHAIAGGGQKNSSYDASYNIVLEQIHNRDRDGSFHFDMHKDPNLKLTAGGEITIHHNTFSDYHSDGTDRYSSNNNPSIHIRNRPPAKQSKIYQNWFFDNNIRHAVRNDVYIDPAKIFPYPGSHNLNVGINYVSMDQNETGENEWNYNYWPVPQ